MPAYFIAQINISDFDEYQEYLDAYDEVFDRFQGRVLAVDDEVVTLEGEWPAARTVMIQFPSRSDLLDWYESPEYQSIAQYRRNASDGNIVIVQGRE